MNKQEAYTLMNVCLGIEPPDILIRRATILNVYTGELIPSQDIAIKGSRIAHVGKWGYGIDGISKVIDANGLFALPGFIDGHTHFLYLASPYEYIKHTIPTGTTTIITELMEIYTLAGQDGMLSMIGLLKEQPIRLFFTVPSMVSTSSIARGIKKEDLVRLLSLEEVVGMGESYWQSVLQDRETYVPNMLFVRERGKTLEGHTAGAREGRLTAYVSLGVSSCHEPVRTDEALERARLGLWVMVREGAVRKDLKQIAPLLASLPDLRRFVLCSDGIDPEELITHGYMDALIRKAISLGVSPIKAIQMATLNVAEHFGLGHLIGGIAPSRYADVLLAKDLSRVELSHVISGGRVSVEEGCVVTSPTEGPFGEEFLKSMAKARRFAGEDFRIAAPTKGDSKTIAIKMVTDLVTQMEEVLVPQEGGYLQIDASRGLNTVAAVERRRDPGRYFVGIVKDFNLRKGAFACSAAWDTTDLIVLGADPEDMAWATNYLFESQGGAVIVVGKKIVWELPMPLLGIMSLMDLKEIAKGFRDLKAMAKTLGISFRDPLLSLSTLTTSAIPFFRICDEGYVDLKLGKTLTQVFA